MPRAVSNPPNPWNSTHVEWLGEPPAAELSVYEEEARSVVSENDSPDVPFRFSVNPYRGCVHACAYCYARPTHGYLGWGAGTDFDRKIVVKKNAPEVLRRELGRRSWKGEVLVFSGITDCYQPLEASYGITRRCLEVCREFRNPVVIITKATLIRRDLDLLADMARNGLSSVFLSIPFADEKTCRLLEPATSSPAQRFETMRQLSEAAIPIGVAIAPVIPGLNDARIPEILERARDCGAGQAFMVLLRLPAEVLPVFRERVEEAFPRRAGKIMSGIRDMRQGKLNQNRFGERMRGTGPRWEAIQDLFDLHRRRLGFSLPGKSQKSPERYRQARLFD